MNTLYSTNPLQPKPYTSPLLKKIKKPASKKPSTVSRPRSTTSRSHQQGPLFASLDANWTLEMSWDWDESNGRICILQLGTLSLLATNIL